MKTLVVFLKTTLIGGLVIVLPAYVSVLLVLHTLGAAAAVVQPISSQLPRGAPHPQVLAVLLLLGVCFLAGLLARTVIGRHVKAAVERSVLERVPGYALLRGLAEQFGETQKGRNFSAALVVIEDALVPAFIVERHADGRFTVFVPSAPTPAVGSIYILTADRVHLLDVPLVTAMACVTKWGSGSSELLAAMKPSIERQA